MALLSPTLNLESWPTPADLILAPRHLALFLRLYTSLLSLLNFGSQVSPVVLSYILPKQQHLTKTLTQVVARHRDRPTPLVESYTAHS